MKMTTNKLYYTHPHLAAQWHPSKNGGLSVETVSFGSRKKVWWIDEYGHEWEASILSRASGGRGCPVCSGHKLVKGVNDLQSKYPELAQEWDLADNPKKSFEMYAGGRARGFWICSNNHLYNAQISKRIQGRNCPFCSGNKVLAGFNDLSTTHPGLSSQWHPTKNGTLTPAEVSAGSVRKVYWVCSSNSSHVWDATIASRANGNKCPVCSNYKVVKGLNNFHVTHPDLAKELHPTLNESLDFSQITSGSGKRVFWMCTKQHVWNTRLVERIYYKTSCPECQAKTFVSQAETDIANYLKDLGLAVEQSNRKLLKGKELDIYIPEKKFAVEFNGLFWHSEGAGKGKSYHHDKWLQCKLLDVQLVQVWEDEWVRNPEQVKQMLAHKLGFSSQKRVYARSTQVCLVDTGIAKAFLEKNHIQGFASGSYYLALTEKNDDTVLALLVLRKESGEDNVLNIIRYATAANVVGGFTKLLKHAEKVYSPESFITFADHCVSDGGLYESNGFVADKILSPDYMYVVKGERKHKFGYRLKRFQNDPELLWEPNLTERELAALNGLERIWDAGKTRYRKFVRSSS